MEISPALEAGSSWIKAVLVVYFDLEFGQKIELLHPTTLVLSKEEESNLVFLAFPDSHSNSTGDTVFSFRFPRATRSAGCESHSIESVHLNGFVFNRVQRDKSIKRGYLQKSVVILTERSDILLWPLFRHVAGVIGPEYFECRESAEAFLQAVFQEMASWPKLSAGATHELPLLGSVIQYYVATDEFRGCGYEGAVSNVFYSQSLLSKSLSPVDELSVYLNLHTFLSELWTLWEIVLCGESLLVVGQTPEQTSNVVLSLVSLVLPLRYGGEYRPYFTIHDSDFRRICASHTAGNVVVGVTNPFFLRECKDWPNKLLLQPQSIEVLQKLSTSAPVVNTAVPPPKQACQLVTRHKMMLSPGGSLLEELLPLKGSKGHAGEANWRDINWTIARANNRAIRRHFFERTQQFLVPLESYFTSLMPIIPSAMSASGCMPDADRLIRAFDKADFLKRVAEQQTGGLFEGKRRVELYRRFVNSRSFDLWYFEKMLRTKTHLLRKNE